MSLSLTLAEPDSQLLTKKINCSFETPFSTTFLKFTKILFEKTEKKKKKSTLQCLCCTKTPMKNKVSKNLLVSVFSVKKNPHKR